MSEIADRVETAGPRRRDAAEPERRRQRGWGGVAPAASGRRQLQGAAVVECRGDSRAALGRIGARVGQVTMK
jgi:hypothetical protein